MRSQIRNAAITLLALASTSMVAAATPNAADTNATGKSMEPTESTGANNFDQRRWFPYIGIGWDFGGDKLAEVEYEFIGVNETIRAGDGFSLDLGVDFHINDLYMIRGTYGWKEDAVSASNGDISFSRNQLSLTGYRFFGNHGWGLGLLKHNNVEYDCDVDGSCNESIDVSDADATVLEYLYRRPHSGGRVGVTGGIRMSQGIEYKADEPGAETVEGDFVGFTLGLYF